MIRFDLLNRSAASLFSLMRYLIRQYAKHVDVTYVDTLDRRARGTLAQHFGHFNLNHVFEIGEFTHKEVPENFLPKPMAEKPESTETVKQEQFVGSSNNAMAEHEIVTKQVESSEEKLTEEEEESAKLTFSDVSKN